MYKINTKHFKKIMGYRGFIYKDRLLLLFLADAMVAFIVAMLKLNLKRILKQNMRIIHGH